MNDGLQKNDTSSQLFSTRGRAPRKRGVICVCCCCSVLLSVSVVSYVVLTLVLVRAVIWQSRGSEVVELVGRQLFVVDYV